MNIGLGLPISDPAADAFTGDASTAAAGILTTPGPIRSTLAQFADLGADEVMLYCWARDAGQIDRLADLVA